MLKFIVVLFRRPDVSAERFQSILRGQHGVMAEQLPGLRRYIQNHVAPNQTRQHPGWDAVVELHWDDWASMERRGAPPKGDVPPNTSPISWTCHGRRGQLWKRRLDCDCAERRSP